SERRLKGCFQRRTGPNTRTLQFSAVSRHQSFERIELGSVRRSFQDVRTTLLRVLVTRSRLAARRIDEQRHTIEQCSPTPRRPAHEYEIAWMKDHDRRAHRIAAELLNALFVDE